MGRVRSPLRFPAAVEHALQQRWESAGDDELAARVTGLNDGTIRRRLANGVVPWTTDHHTGTCACGPRTCGGWRNPPADDSASGCYGLLYTPWSCYARYGLLMRVVNPYTPGFNQAPAVLAGRGDVIAAMEEAFEVAALDGRTPRPILLTGSRGVGKTVLLEEARRIAAQQHSWVHASVEVPPGRAFIPSLIARLEDAKRAYDQAPPDRAGWRVEKATIKASVVGVGGEAELTRGGDTGPVREDALTAAFETVMAAAEAVDAGLLVTVDEVHLAAKDELATLAALLQSAVTRRWPLVIVLAGLPSMQDPKQMVTYLERGEWHTLGLLSEDDTRQALAEPARDSGRPLDNDATDVLTTSSGGYPYAIQVLGHHTWRASGGADHITVAHARTGDKAAQRDMADGLYSARWKDASDREQDYLTALARLLTSGAQPIGADVARELGQASEAVTYLRARLLQKGTIYTDGRVLRFEVPGMARWINDHRPAEPDR